MFGLSGRVQGSLLRDIGSSMHFSPREILHGNSSVGCEGRESSLDGMRRRVASGIRAAM